MSEYGAQPPRQPIRRQRFEPIVAYRKPWYSFQKPLTIAALPLPPEVPPSEPMSQERQHRENEEDNEKYLRPFPGDGCHSCESKKGSDQRDHQKHDCEM